LDALTKQFRFTSKSRNRADRYIPTIYTATTHQHPPLGKIQINQPRVNLPKKMPDCSNSTKSRPVVGATLEHAIGNMTSKQL